MKFDRHPSARRNRNRKIISFNPPFSQNVKKTGKYWKTLFQITAEKLPQKS